jgi:hypothetical protein
MVFLRNILTKCTVQEAKCPVNISSGSVARRDLIPALKGKGLMSNIIPDSEGQGSKMRPCIELSASLQK